jgi:hypothetical protein
MRRKPSVPQIEHAIRSSGKLWVMGDHDKGSSVRTAELFNQRKHLTGRLPIKVSSGLVSQHATGRRDQGSGQCHSLSLAA